MVGRLRAVAAFVIAFVPSIAHADPAHDAAARALFEKGRELLKSGETAEACEQFAKSHQLHPGAGTLLNLGDCYVQLGRRASAWAAYREAEKLATDAKNQRSAAEARLAAEKLESQVSWLTVRVDAKPPGFAVTRNGSPVPAATYDVPLPVDAGVQVLVAEAPGRESWRTTFELREGEKKEVRLPELERVKTAEPPAPREAAPPVQLERSETPAPLKIAVGLEIGGGVVLGAGLVLGAFAIASWSSVESICPAGRCATDADAARVASDADAASALATASSIATVAGAAFLAGGVLLHVLAPRRVSLAPVIQRTGFGLSAALTL